MWKAFRSSTLKPQNAPQATILYYAQTAEMCSK
jgi:hypothetical protein